MRSITAVQAGLAAASTVASPSVGRCDTGSLCEAPAGARSRRTHTRDCGRGPRLGDRARARHAPQAQKQALAARLFHYRSFLGQELPWLDDLVRARGPERLPVVRPRAIDRRFEDYDLVLETAAAGVAVALLRLPLAAEWLRSGRLRRVARRSIENPAAHVAVVRRGEVRPAVQKLLTRLTRLAAAPDPSDRPRSSVAWPVPRRRAGRGGKSSRG